MAIQMAINLSILMVKKQKKAKMAHDSEELWIAPRYSLKGPAGERAWENRAGGAPSSSRYLELADIALGLKKTTAPKKKNLALSAHDRKKTEPYAPK
ncbi:MAG TPA: hypothetical protein VLA83_20155 [Candidatus Binatia bacterium]|nr:hypothetical protein [Candidatus Binatia bacterium]